MLFETKGREEDPQILIRKHTGGGTLQGDASKQLETLYKPEQVDKLNNAKVDVLKLCRQWWEEFKRTTRKDVIEKSDVFKDKDGNNDSKALRYRRALEDKGLLESNADTTENGSEIALCPLNNRPVTAIRMLRHSGIEDWQTMQKMGWRLCAPPMRLPYAQDHRFK